MYVGNIVSAWVYFHSYIIWKKLIIILSKAFKKSFFELDNELK